MIRKVKNWLGIEGVKISLDTNESFDLSSGNINGSFTISSQSSQFIQSVNVKLIERYQRGRRKSKLIDEYYLGEMNVSIDQSIEKDELIHREFSLSFEALNSAVDKFGKKNPIYRGLASVAKLLKNAKSKYFLEVEATVEGNKLKPYDKLEVITS